MKRKFGRIGHIQGSHLQNDDFYSDYFFLNNTEVVITEKLDGECTVLATDYFHARSIDSGGTPWRSMIAKLWAELHYMIPHNIRICGENMQAKHSIAYKLPSPFFVFVITRNDVILSWEETVQFCKRLSLYTVPVIFKGRYNEKQFSEIWASYKKNIGQEVEGYVIRNAAQFNETDFSSNIVKYVRSNHVQTDEHWTKIWTPNEIDAKYQGRVI